MEFVWKDSARFKHLKAEDAGQKGILSSFGVSVGRLVIAAADGGGSLGDGLVDLRDAILAGHHFVDLQNLIGACWGQVFQSSSFAYFRSKPNVCTRWWLSRTGASLSSSDEADDIRLNCIHTGA